MIHDSRSSARRAAGVLAAIAALTTSAALAAPHDEYRLKAAFLLNFAKLVEWPEGAGPGMDDPIVLGVQATPHIVATIRDGLADARVGAHEISVVPVESADQLPDVHILFISAAHGQSKEIVSAARKSATLVVGETAHFAESGGTINFYTESNKLRFEINPGAARSAGLVISSRLLGLAKLVEGSR